MVIGGIFLSNAAKLILAGADGIAVVRDISESSDLAGRAAQWLVLFMTDKQLNVQIYDTYAAMI